MQPEITQHIWEIRAQRMAVKVGDKRVVSQIDKFRMEETHDNDFTLNALDEVGIMNLENMMEG